MYHKRPWYEDPTLFSNIAVVCTLTLIFGAYLVVVFSVGFSPYMQLPEKVIAISGITVILIMWLALIFADHLKNKPPRWRD
jgi:hypothetical protein|nr:MAG TPA: hypothetical protein [Caudoviricetes sp.]